ncbi:hypothetical protein MFIFM68171_07008 [Madurella fahalii]|uniref:Uncharacterized protein n=1 Tax=Madurella fahalii TaxID=1157608 RepID=A0ABQ0GGB6_9PEZI
MKAAQLSSILFLFQSTITLAIAMTTDKMDSSLEQHGVVKRSDNGESGPVDITLWQGPDDGEPNLTCDDADADLGVTCEDLPFGDCCMGESDDDIFDSADHNEPTGWTNFGIYAGPLADPCQQLLERKREVCLAGSSHGSTVTGASVEGPSAARKRQDGSTSGLARRAVRPNKYTHRIRDTDYHLDINSPLGEEYRNLTSKEAKRAFMIKYGEPKPTVNKRWLAKRESEGEAAH